MEDLEDNFKRMADENPNIIDQLEKTLIAKKEAYEGRRHRKYYCLALGLLVGIFMGYLAPFLINKVTHALY